MKTKNTINRTIPRGRDALLILAIRAANAVRRLASEIGLLQNTPERLDAEIFDLVGEAGGPVPTGKQGRLNSSRAEVTAARAQRRAVIGEARAFAGLAVDMLKSRFGRRWNPLWEEAGFTRFSLAIPRDPEVLLINLRGYFQANPEREVAQLDLTAERADALATQVGAAHDAVNTKRRVRADASQGRDAAIAQLRRRLRALHAELMLLLSPDDNRWTVFGFRRPSDRRQPAPVSAVELHPGLPGEVRVTWPAAPRAKDYRVSRQIVDVDAEPVEVGRFVDREVILRGLPSGSVVRVFVSARNESGESLSHETSMAVP
jgi:hypothetical protein